MPNLTQDDRDFVREVRRIILAVEEGGPEEASAGAGLMRHLLASRNLGPGCHVGRKDLDGSIAMVEWYAGQYLDICESSSWFAMNSLINCIDKFAPADWT